MNSNFFYMRKRFGDELGKNSKLGEGILACSTFE
jgi:hypothetical protein